jgi:lipopolysaccharide assembly protein A
VQIAFILTLVVAIVVAIVAIQNTTPVALTFMFWQIPGVPASLLILGATAVGAVLMLILGLSGWFRNWNARRGQGQTIGRLEADLTRERARPATSAEPAPQEK